MNKFIAAIEIDRRRETREAQVDRLTRQLREANAKVSKAFDQGMQTAVAMLRQGATIDQIESKILPEHVIPATPRDFDPDDTARIAIPMELEDSDEHTEPCIVIPMIPRRASTETGH